MCAREGLSALELYSVCANVCVQGGNANLLQLLKRNSEVTPLPASNSLKATVDMETVKTQCQHHCYRHQLNLH